MQQNLKEVYRYLRALSRYRYLATIVALLVMTAIGGYSFTLPKLYQADSTVFIEKNVIDRLVQGLAVTSNINDKVAVLQYALSSRDLIMKALEEMDSEIFLKSSAEQQNFIAGLKERTQIRVRGNDLFTVSLMGSDPTFVQKYINTLVGKYVEENISGKREEAYGANRFLAEQIETFKAKLEKAEDNIIAFRKAQGIYFSVDETSNVEEIKKYLSRIESIELSLDTLQAQKLQLQEQLDTLSPTVESYFGLDDTSIGIEGDPQLAAMENHLSNLRLRYTDNYPEIVRLKFEIVSLRKRLEKQAEQVGQDEPIPGPDASKMTSMNPLYLDVQQRMSEVESGISSKKAEIQNLKRLIVKRESELHDVPANRKELNVLIQERDSYQKIYQDLLARMGQSEVSKQMELGNRTATFRIVDPAVLPEIPVSPNMFKMFLLAVAGGLGCAVGLVFLLETLDSRVRNVEVFKELGIEVLAIVPNISDEQALRRNRKRDLIFFGVTCIYGFCFMGMFAYGIYLR